MITARRLGATLTGAVQASTFLPGITFGTSPPRGASRAWTSAPRHRHPLISAMARACCYVGMLGCAEPSPPVAEEATGAAPPTRGAPRGGFPQYDSDGEVTLLGRPLPSDVPVAVDATTMGRWTTHDGRLLVDPSSSQLDRWWFPNAAEGTFQTGMVRARIEVTDTIDVSILVRQQVLAETGVASGYGVTIKQGQLRLDRWDSGNVQPMIAELDMPISDVRTLEIVIVSIGTQLFVSVYDGDSFEQLATAAAHDSTYRSGAVGIRVGPKHDSNAAITLLTVTDAGALGLRGEPAGSGASGHQIQGDATPFGRRRYALVDESDAATLPQDLQAHQQTSIEKSGVRQTILALDTISFERLRRSGVPIRAVYGDLGWATLDRSFRERANTGPRAVEGGFVLDDGYKDPAMVEALLRAYHQRYPTITLLMEIGHSHQGRPILALKVSDSPTRTEDEPAILVDAAHHGSELLSVEYALDMIDQLVRGYGVNPSLTKAIDGLEIWFVPLVNPDGLYRFMHEGRSLGRKNGRDTNEDGHFDRFEGVDLNRNYPFGWSDDESVASSASSYYRGPSPGSEPETQAMMRLGEREHFAAVLSFHADGTDIYPSYVDEARRAPVPDPIAAIGNELATVSPWLPNRRRYAVRDTPRPVTGCATDWHTHRYGAVSYVVEGSHTHPELDIRTRSVEGTRPIWKALLNRVLEGAWIGGRVLDHSGRPLVAEVMLEETQTFEGELWRTRASDGRFDRAVVGPGQYTLLVRLSDGVRLRRKIEVVGGRADVTIVAPVP